MRCARRASKRSGLPSGLVSSGRPYLPRALLLVTRGGLFWMVALDPARWAIRGFGGIVISSGRSSPHSIAAGRPAREPQSSAWDLRRIRWHPDCDPAKDDFVGRHLIVDASTYRRRNLAST